MLSVKVRTAKEVLSLTLAKTSTFEALKIEIAEKANIDGDFDVLAGFPLKPLTLQDEDVIDGHISNNEVLRVQAKELSGQQAQGHSKYRPSKRAKTAAASTETSKKTVSTVAASPSASGFGARIATLSSSSGSASNKFRGSSGRVSRPAGFTVFAPSGVRSDQPSGRRRVRQASKPRQGQTQDGGQGTTESDISEHLISAVSGGSSRRDKVLRKVFRSAVEYQYSSSKAVARLQAVYAGTYNIEASASARILGSGMSSQLDVTFPRGGGQRGTFSETVELLGEELLKALLKVAVEDTEGEGKEVLKPMNLARCSPRIFWSIVHRYGSNLIDAIQRLLAGVDDCSWLTLRKRELSDKAKENERQEQERAAVRELRKRKREGGSATASEGTNEPPTSTESPQNTSSTSVAQSKPAFPQLLSSVISSLTLSLVAAEHHEELRNWLKTTYEQKFDADGAVGELPWLLLLSNASDEDIDHFTATTASTAAASCLSKDQVSLWISSAQSILLQYLWQIVCGGGSERLRLALKALRIRNPSEILLWRSAVSGLHSGLQQRDSALPSIGMLWPAAFRGPFQSERAEGSPSSSFTVDHVQFMVQLCQTATSVCPWMKEYERIVFDEDDNKAADDDAGENDAENEVSFDEWLTQEDAHEFMGKRVRIIVLSEEDEDDDNDEEQQDSVSALELLPIGSYWEEGHVMGYLPPTDEEPMALWRVRLEEKPQPTTANDGAVQAKTPRYEDLEEHEIVAAIKRSQFHL